MAENETIVIMGAGLAGMSAAKMLRNGSRRIILVDQSFGSVPQSTQLHVLLGKGQQLLKQHFPEVYGEIAAHCPQVNWGNETYWRAPAGALPKRQLGISTYLLSRSYLDELLLADLRLHADCELVEGSVRDITFSADQTMVNAVHLDDRELVCDLCIDCTGRSSKIPSILESTFAQAVEVTEVKTSLKYYTTMARRKKQGSYRQAYFQIDPQKEQFGGVISPIENDKLIATFITVDKSFRREGNPFLKIADDAFQEFVGEMEFETEYTPFGQLHNKLHHFEKFAPLPHNLFLIGDSVCQFNPVFGQGMTIALQSAELLCDFLATSDSRALAFQRNLEKLIKFPWAISTMDPYNPEATMGLRQTVTRAFMHRMIRKSQSYPATHQALVEVLHMLESPKSLLAPQHLF
jgi:2-polyprenyl-6-methoxyphenol hydroxylase-like FAD-dependent oxidoreductase